MPSITVIPAADLKTGGLYTVPFGTDAYDGVEIAVSNNAATLLLVLNAKSSGDCTVHGGTGIFAKGDLYFEVPSEGVYLVDLEIARYLHTSGEHAGKILVSSSTSDVKVAAVQVS